MIRWIIIGTGNAGRCHIAAIERTPAACVAGLVTADDPSRTDYPVFATLAAALKVIEADAVVIATPTNTHLALASEALYAKLPVLCEKPVGRNAQEAELLYKLSLQQNIPVGVVLNQRACVHTRWIHEQIHEGSMEPQAVTMTGGIPRFQGWMNDPEKSGGGLLRSVGIHFVDLLVWWLGLPVWLAATKAGRPIENNVSLLATFKNGCQACIHLTSINSSGRGPISICIEADGSRLKLDGHEIVLFEGCAPPPECEIRDEALTFGPGHLCVIQEASQMLLERKEFPISLAMALPSLYLLDQIYEATGSC
ncbi:MAG: Gfo/Idh/MocA family oxidoreductase [Woeseia sp.]